MARRLVFVLLAALALAGCDSDSPTAPADPPAADSAPDDAPDSAADGAPDSAPASPEPPVDGPLSFTAVTLNGEIVDLAVFNGTPVVVWFWAPWCTICRGEAPIVAEVAADYEGVTFLGIAGLGEVPNMQAFVTETGTGGFEHFADTDGTLWQRFGVATQPSYAFVSADGEVDVTFGALGGGLRERTEALLE